MSNRDAAIRVDLNVTPLIDVLLVLLVIFMAALPLTQTGLDATVPSNTRPSAEAARSDQIVLRYDADGLISINQQPVTASALPERLRLIYGDRTDKTLYILGDASLRYRSIVSVIDAAKGAGVSRVGIITEGMRRAAAH